MKIFWKVLIPCETKSEMNMREHWAARSKRFKAQRTWIEYFWAKDKPNVFLPCTIKMTRFSKQFLDSDSIYPCLKHFRDTIADLITPGLAPGRADNNPQMTWQYNQEKLQKGSLPGVEILIFTDD